MSRTFRPFTRKKKAWTPPNDWKAPAYMSRLVTPAWEIGRKLTVSQKKKVHV